MQNVNQTHKFLATAFLARASAYVRFALQVAKKRAVWPCLYSQTGLFDLSKEKIMCRWMKLTIVLQSYN